MALLILLLTAFAVLLPLAMIARHRWAVLRDVILAIVVAFGVCLVIGRVVLGSWPQVWDSLWLTGSTPYFPPTGAGGHRDRRRHRLPAPGRTGAQGG